MLDKQDVEEVLSHDPSYVEAGIFAATSILYSFIVLLDYNCGFDTSDWLGRVVSWIDDGISHISQNLPVTVRYEEKMRGARHLCNIPLIKHIYAANLILLAVSAVAILVRSKRHIARFRRERQENSAVGRKGPPLAMGVLGSLAIGITIFSLWFWGNMAIGESSWANSRVYADKWYVFVDTGSCLGMLICFQALVTLIGVSRIENARSISPGG